MDVPRNAADLIMPARLTDSSGQPIAAVTADNPLLSCAAMRPGDADYQPVPLAAGTIGEYAANSWVPTSHPGYYQFCPANDLIVPGRATKILIMYDGEVIPGIINAVGDTGEPMAVAIAAQLSALSLRRFDSAARLATDVQLVRGTTWRIPITVDDLPEGWTRIEFTARAHASDSQSASLLHLVLSAPADASTDGLRILSGAAAADPSLGSIAVVDDQAVATIAAEAVANAPEGEFCWDAKVFTAAGVDQVNRGTLFVERDITRSAI